MVCEFYIVVILRISQVLGVPVGQHVHIRAWIGGPLVVRPYTPVSPKEQKGCFWHLHGTSSQYPGGGKMSQHLDSLRIGDSIEVG